jgi:hydroxypyruvate isomerase
MDRRAFMQTGIATAAAATITAAALPGATRAAAQEARPAEAPRKGRLRQSVCRWCFGGMTLDQLCDVAKPMGIQAIDLLDEAEWPVVAKHGLVCSTANGPGGITKGWNRREMHEELIKKSERLLPLVAAAGIPNMIVFSGNRAGMPDDEGMRTCAEGLKRIMPLAEKHGVTVIMELLNSKVDHKDYMCDRSNWGVGLCKLVGSERFKLLYDIYHMQIMEGDVIRTIRDHHAHFGHYHTAGNPGRSNLDQTQELNYRGICEAIVATGFKGYLAQEFMPRGDAATALRQAVEVCDV